MGGTENRRTRITIVWFGVGGWVHEKRVAFPLPSRDVPPGEWEKERRLAGGLIAIGKSKKEATPEGKLSGGLRRSKDS